jgi:hypothetical protein
LKTGTGCSGTTAEFSGVTGGKFLAGFHFIRTAIFPK